MGRMRPTLALTASLILAIGLTACGDDDDADTADTADTADAARRGNRGARSVDRRAGDDRRRSGNVGRRGGDRRAGEPFTLGFTNPLGSNDQLSVLQRAIEARAECLGGTVVSLDSNLDVDKQISDIDQLVSQGVDGIIVFPLDAQAVIPAVERARDAGIKTVGVNVSLEDPEVADVAPFDASVNQGTEQMATETAEFVIDQLGGQGNVLGVGIGFPVPVIDYQMAVMEEAVTAGGLTWLDKVDNPTDDSAGAQPVVEQALLRFDDLQAIMAYNEPSAARRLRRSQRRRPHRRHPHHRCQRHGVRRRRRRGRRDRGDMGPAAVEAGRHVRERPEGPARRRDGRDDDRGSRADAHAGEPVRPGRLGSGRDRHRELHHRGVSSVKM